MKCSSTGPLQSASVPSFLKLLNLAALKAAPGFPTNHSVVKLYSRRLLGELGGRRRRSLLDSGREVGASRLDDLGPRGAGLVVLVAVVRGGAAVTAGAAVLVLAHVHDHAGGGGRGRVELVLLPCDWSTGRETLSHSG